jgi:hypothetical protein
MQHSGRLVSAPVCGHAPVEVEQVTGERRSDEQPDLNDDEEEGKQIDRCDRRGSGIRREMQDIYPDPDRIFLIVFHQDLIHLSGSTQIFYPCNRSLCFPWRASP